MEKSRHSFASGFLSQVEEFSEQNLLVNGQLPDWLNGQLLRIGPSLFEAASEPMNHWFDGYARLTSLKFLAGSGQAEIQFSSRFLNSQALSRAKARNCLSSDEFASSGHKTFVERLSNLFSPALTDNCNVNILHLDNKSVALTETSKVLEFDRHSLGTMGECQYADALSGHLSTAHPHYDLNNNTSINLLTKLSKQSQYIFYQANWENGGIRRKPMAPVSVSHPGYIHSFALTQKYIVLMECPLLLNPLELLFSGKPYIENYHWHNEKPSRFLVINRHSGALERVLETDACFVFHHVNAFEKEQFIYLDALVYHNADIVNALYLDNLRSPNALVPKPKLVRYKLNLNKGLVSAECPHDFLFEFPTINYERVNTTPYTCMYGVSASSQSAGGFLDQLLKLDESADRSFFWQEENCFPGEPIFVAKPGSTREDEGVILSLVLDTEKETSFLLVLDGQSFLELARAHLPCRMPFGFHGKFIFN